MKITSRYLQQLPLQLALLLIGFLAAFGLQAWAYTEPVSAPPLGDLPAPLNTSSSQQTKVGPLVVNSGAAAIGFTVPSGYVGIGTLTPTTNLQVQGGESLGTSCHPGWLNDALNLDFCTAVDAGRIQVGGGTWKNLLLNPAGGYVGIGTTNPASLLMIDQANVGGGWDAGITLKNNTATHTGHLVESTDGGLQFGIDSTEIGRVKSDGIQVSTGKSFCVGDCTAGSGQGLTANVVATVSSSGGSGSCTALSLTIKGGIITTATGGSC